MDFTLEIYLSFFMVLALEFPFYFVSLMDLFILLVMCLNPSHLVPKASSKAKLNGLFHIDSLLKYLGS